MTNNDEGTSDHQTVEDRLARLEAFLPMLARLDFAEGWHEKSIPTRLQDLEEMVSIESPDISRHLYHGGVFGETSVADWTPSSIPEQERPKREPFTEIGKQLQDRFTERTTPGYAARQATTASPEPATQAELVLDEQFKNSMRELALSVQTLLDDVGVLD